MGSDMPERIFAWSHGHYEADPHGVLVTGPAGDGAHYVRERADASSMQVRVEVNQGTGEHFGMLVVSAGDRILATFGGDTYEAFLRANAFADGYRAALAKLEG